MKIIAFYSFKGGAGRTVTAMNVAAMISKEIVDNMNGSGPILVIDGDVDSAGATLLTNSREYYTNENMINFSDIVSNEVPLGAYDQLHAPETFVGFSDDVKAFFNSSEKLCSSYKEQSNEYFEKDFVGYVENKIKNGDYEIFENHSLSKVLYEFQTKNHSNTFVDIGHLMGCDYANKIKFLGSNPKSIRETGEDKKIESLFLDLMDFCEDRGFKAVIVDCASGFQNIATSVLSNATDIVFCSKITKQFREGTSDFLVQFLEKQKQFLLSPLDDKRIHVLPTVVPKDVDGHYDISINKLKEAINNIEGRLDNNISTVEKKTLFSKIDHSLLHEGGISEVNRFKWEEGILNLISRNTTLKDDENIAMDRYTTVSRHLMEMEKS